MNTTSKILLTAMLSLATGAGATYYATVRAVATCSVTQAALALPTVDHFMDAPAPRIGGGASYGPDALK